jgi:hypothetical protein
VLDLADAVVAHVGDHEAARGQHRDAGREVEAGEERRAAVPAGSRAAVAATRLTTPPAMRMTRLPSLTRTSPSRPRARPIGATRAEAADGVLAPARVATAPEAVTARIRPLAVSATRKPPSGMATTSDGVSSWLVVASPVAMLPGVPVPATVRMPPEAAREVAAIPPAAMAAQDAAAHALERRMGTSSAAWGRNMRAWTNCRHDPVSARPRARRSARP